MNHDDATQQEYADHLSKKVAEELSGTFDIIAKLAIQGSAEAADASLNVVDKVRKAHSRITLIIDDAMRGLANVTEAMFVSGILIGVSVPDDEEDDQSQR